MKVLITGGAGLVGSHCAEFFALNNSKNSFDFLILNFLFFKYNL